MDASETGHGAVLSEIVDGEWCPVAFANRLGSAAERNYNVIIRKLLAVMFALKKFRHYLLGLKFYYTDGSCGFAFAEGNSDLYWAVGLMGRTARRVRLRHIA